MLKLRMYLPLSLSTLAFAPAAIAGLPGSASDLQATCRATILGSASECNSITDYQSDTAIACGNMANQTAYGCGDIKDVALSKFCTAISLGGNCLDIPESAADLYWSCQSIVNGATSGCEQVNDDNTRAFCQAVAYTRAAPLSYIAPTPMDPDYTIVGDDAPVKPAAPDAYDYTIDVSGCANIK